MNSMNGYYFDEIKLGQSAEFAKTVTEADIAGFAGVSGDFNPVHVNEEYAQTTMFKGRIAHGMLSAAFISTVLGTKLPGPGCIYVSQALKFKAPVRIGDTVVAKVTVTEIVAEKRRVTFACECRVGDTVVIDGAATGADTIAHKWAVSHDIMTERFPADWTKYGRRAGAIRNKQMLSVGRPTLVIAFPGGPGTAMMVALAKAKGIRVVEG